MTIRLASDLQEDSIVDGEGVRTVIWTQGCAHKCPGCHNPSTHDFCGGFEVTVDEVISELAKIEGQTGITFSGGDPMFQAEPCAEIAKAAKGMGFDIWCYTGFRFEQLISDKKYLEFLKNIDVLVDGRFVLELRTLNCDFRGSSNQRIIDVKRSLEEQKVVLVEKYAGRREVKIEIPKPAHIYL